MNIVRFVYPSRVVGYNTLSHIILYNVITGPHLLFCLADQDGHQDGRDPFRRSFVLYITAGVSMFFNSNPLLPGGYVARTDVANYSATMNEQLKSTSLNRKKGEHLHTGNTCISMAQSIVHAGAVSMNFRQCPITEIPGRLVLYCSVRYVVCI